MLGTQSSAIITGKLSQAGADAYEVRDVNGNVVSSGTVTGSLLRITTPADGWKRGWYRVYLSGPNTDPTYGNSYGTSSFVVFRNSNWLPTAVGAMSWGTEQQDHALHAMMGLSPQRLVIGDARTGATDDWTPVGDYTRQDTPKSCLQQAREWAAAAPNDPSKTWNVWLLFPNGTTDVLWIPNTVSGQSFVSCYVKDGTVDGSTVFVSSGPGTTAGAKIQVYSPDAATLVETYDNLPSSDAAESTINAASSYIRAYAANGGTIATSSPTAIGNAYYNGVKATVQHLYPEGVHYYDGPSNEPLGGGTPTAALAHQMKLFSDAVHAGNASAKALGGSFVSADKNHWQTWFDLGADAYCDEFSTHFYNIYGGALNLSRINVQKPFFDTLTDIMAKNGSTKPIWDTEGMQTGYFGGGTYNPHNHSIAGLLLQHRYAIKSSYWYDTSHGFNYCDWIVNSGGTGGLNPQAVQFRVTAEEIYGMMYDHPVDFGSVEANEIFFGNVYRDATTGDELMVVTADQVDSTSSITVTLSLSGTVPSSLTVVDVWGNESLVTVSASQATVTVDDQLTFIRIPSGAHASIASVLDWGAAPDQSVSQHARCTLAGNVSFVSLDGSRSTFSVSTTTPPAAAEVHFNSLVSVSRILVCLGVNYDPLTAFDVETSSDGGTTWTTRTTVSRPITTVTNYNSWGSGISTSTDQFTPPKGVYSVSLGGTYSVNAIRVNITGTATGTAPAIAEIAVPSSSTPTAYSSGYSTLVRGDSGIIGYWRLNETSGSTAHSEINSPADDATVTGTFDFEAPGPYAGAAYCLNLGTTNGYLQLPSKTVSDVFSLSWWSQYEAYPPGMHIAVSLAGGIGSAGNLIYSAGTYSVFNVSTATAFEDTSWHHFVLTKNGGTVKIYVDGADVTGTVGTVPTVNTISPEPSNCFKFSEFAVYNRELSSTDVSNLYQSASIPTAAPSSDTSWFAPAPKIVGTGNSGRQVHCTTGQWLNAPTKYAYQWKRNGTAITGATSAEYVVQALDVGTNLTCTVTASNLVGSGTQDSAALAVT